MVKILLKMLKVCAAQSFQYCLGLCDPVDCCLAVSSVHGMELSRKEYWNGLPCPSPGDLPDSEINPGSPALAGGFLTIEPPEEPTVRKCLVPNLILSFTN